MFINQSLAEIQHILAENSYLLDLDTANGGLGSSYESIVFKYEMHIHDQCGNTPKSNRNHANIPTIAKTLQHCINAPFEPGPATMKISLFLPNCPNTSMLIVLSQLS